MLDQLLPNRRQVPGNDPIFLANAEATKAKAAGVDVLNATMGALLDDEGRLVILETVMDLWRQLSPMDIAPYAAIAGDPPYLTAIVQRHWPTLGHFGVGCATPGGTGALMICLRNFLHPGMKLLSAAPYWGPYAILAAENLVELATVPFPEAGQHLEAQAWEEAGARILAEQGRLLLWLNDPCHNPTGHSLSHTDREALFIVLRRLAQRGPVTLLLDFAYLDYTADPGHVRDALNHYAGFGREGTVLVGASLSLSKALTLYGARAGALVFPFTESTALQAALGQSCRGAYSNCAKAPQVLMTRLSQTPDALARLESEHAHWRSVMVSRAEALDAALKQEGFPGAPWRGGFFITLRHPDACTLASRLKHHGIFVVPLPQGIRIGLCGMRADSAPRFATALRASWDA